jgi:hypothetical protein
MLDMFPFACLQMRHQIDQILEELWRDDRCRECIRQHATASAAVAAAAAAGGPNPAAAAAGSAGVPGGLFAGFVSAVLNDLMYLFKDSLERLADIKQIEDSKADAAVSGGAFHWVVCCCVFYVFYCPGFSR